MTRSNPVTAPPSAEAESRNTPPLKLSREERKGLHLASVERLRAAASSGDRIAACEIIRRGYVGRRKARHP